MLAGKPSDGGGCAEVLLTRASTRTRSNGTRISCASSFFSHLYPILTFVSYQSYLCRHQTSPYAGFEIQETLLWTRWFSECRAKRDGYSRSPKSLVKRYKGCSIRSTYGFVHDCIFIGWQQIPVAFYLILDVAVGGTNGWFPDGGSEKPWLDGSRSKPLLFDTEELWFE